MSAAHNPFKPTAGAPPPLLIGRRGALDEFEESLDDGPGAPARLMTVTGARGVGKTVLLSETVELVRARGWVHLSDTATPGLIGRLTVSASALLTGLDAGSPPIAALSGLTLPVVGGGSTLAPRPEQSVHWRQEVARLLDLLEQHGTGLLITVDEVHRSAREDLRELASSYQHLVTQGRDVALVAAGLPSSISDLLNDDVLTFLRRATPLMLGEVAVDEVAAGLERTFGERDRLFEGEPLEVAAAATEGYPFMIQLVGYQVWRRTTGSVVDLAAVEAALPVARARLGSTVHATALHDLSDVDRAYLAAMAVDDAPSRTVEVARRLGRTIHYADRYRQRLLATGLVHAPARGEVDFAVPYLREYVREHPPHRRVEP